jgi:2-polyprenyl-3-methyl-5-hydroxy-6-metoxy-1,4-benzoquinol methylase
MIETTIERTVPAAAKTGFDSPSNCPFCAHPKIFIKYDMGEHKIWRCGACTFMWLFPRPKTDDLKEVYDVSYFQNANFFAKNSTNLYGYYDYIAERFSKQSSDLPIVRKLKSLLPGFQDGKSRFLDVGCGMGYLLDVAHDQGFQVAGVEFNPSAADRLRSKYAFPVHVGDVLDFRAEPFDVITLMDVIEHFINPFESVEHIADLLKPGGVLAISTMDCDSWVSRILGSRLEDFRRVREHLCFFTRQSIRILLEKYGFEVISIHFYGHTFRLGFLADRVKLISVPMGKAVYYLVKLLGLLDASIHLNPMTKMIVYARKNSC